MTLLTFSARRVTTASVSRISTTNSLPCVTTAFARHYSGAPIKVAHYEEGWTADGVGDEVKSIERYSMQTFNKISQVVSMQ